MFSEVYSPLLNIRILVYEPLNEKIHILNYQLSRIELGRILYKLACVSSLQTRERWNLVPPNKRKFIYTSMSISSCGLPDLEKKETYLFAGMDNEKNIG